MARICTQVHAWCLATLLYVDGGADCEASYTSGVSKPWIWNGLYIAFIPSMEAGQISSNGPLSSLPFYGVFTAFPG